MFVFRSYTAVGALAASSLGMAAFLNPLPHGGLGPIIIETRPRVHTQGPGGKRVPLKTKRGREIGNTADPFFGIKSRGRRGAAARARLMAEAYAKTGRRDRGNPSKVKSRPFNDRKHPGRNTAFDAALNAGHSHNQALKLARRVSAPASVGRPVPVTTSGPVPA